MPTSPTLDALETLAWGGPIRDPFEDTDLDLWLAEET